jgi:hypothetical protein
MHSNPSAGIEDFVSSRLHSDNLSVWRMFQPFPLSSSARGRKKEKNAAASRAPCRQRCLSACDARRMTRCARGDPTRAQCGTLCVVAARTPLRCGPVWRAINYIFDAAWMCEQLQRPFILHGAKKRNTVHTTVF